MGSRADLDAMLTAPVTDFSFSPGSAAAYQLGNFGTASKLLHSWICTTDHPGGVIPDRV
jgi:hypothetical protein